MNTICDMTPKHSRTKEQLRALIEISLEDVKTATKKVTAFKIYSREEAVALAAIAKEELEKIGKLWDEAIARCEKLE
jgi:uncharacterized protein YpmS